MKSRENDNEDEGEEDGKMGSKMHGGLGVEFMNIWNNTFYSSHEKF